LIPTTISHNKVTIKMASALPATATNPTATAAVANTGFRLGDEEQFSDSDSDQSQTSKRSLSPTRKEGEVHKSRKKKRMERQAMGAVTEKLVDVLGSAFAAPTADTQAGASLFDLRACNFQHALYSEERLTVIQQSHRK
jgi:hypothetical protein